LESDLQKALDGLMAIGKNLGYDAMMELGRRFNGYDRGNLIDNAILAIRAVEQVATLATDLAEIELKEIKDVYEAWK
jgi:hypothetical protein